MIPVLIGAAVGAAAAYKFFEHHERQEKTSTRIISESEVPPDVLKKIEAKRRERQKKF